MHTLAPALTALTAVATDGVIVADQALMVDLVDLGVHSDVTTTIMPERTEVVGSTQEVAYLFEIGANGERLLARVAVGVTDDGAVAQAAHYATLDGAPVTRAQLIESLYL